MVGTDYLSCNLSDVWIDHSPNFRIMYIHVHIGCLNCYNGRYISLYIDWHSTNTRPILGQHNDHIGWSSINRRPLYRPTYRPRYYWQYIDTSLTHHWYFADTSPMLHWYFMDISPRKQIKRQLKYRKKSVKMLEVMMQWVVKSFCCLSVKSFKEYCFAFDIVRDKLNLSYSNINLPLYLKKLETQTMVLIIDHRSWVSVL